LCCLATSDGGEGIAFAFGEPVELVLLLRRERARKSALDEPIQETTHLGQLSLYFVV